MASTVMCDLVDMIIGSATPTYSNTGETFHIRLFQTVC